MLLCRSAEPRAPSNSRAHSSLSQNMPNSPSQTAASRNSNSPDYYKSAMLASQPVSGLNSHFEDGSLTLTAPVSPETKLVATIPTTTAAYAAPAAHSGDFQPDSMTADLENAKSAMQAYLQQEAAHCAKQSCTSDLGGCLDCNTVPAAPLVDTAQAVTMKAAGCICKLARRLAQ